jgi:hypothetical protein
MPEELRAAAHEFAGHALALSLLAGFLKLLHGGDVRKRNHIRPVIDDPNDPGHDQARRVIEAFANDWLAGEPVLLAIMQMVGLFDRPANADWIKALRAKPSIDGLTNSVADLDADAWRIAIARLRDVRLLDPEDSLSPDAIDAHPLVREWFGERLKATNREAWRAAHGRLFEHLRDATKEGRTPTLEDLAPLYQAIAHGCRAGRYQEALDGIYTDRICRRRPDGDIEFYARRKLGAVGSDLAALSWFFDKPYATPAAALTPADGSWVLSLAALRLHAQGRFAEALPADRAGLVMDEDSQDWRNAAISAANLSETELLVGEVIAAVATVEKSVAHADRSGVEFEMMSKRATYAAALQAAGRRDEAARVFADAVGRQKEWQPSYPLLYSKGGFWYCDLLLDQGKHAAARDWAAQTLKWAMQQNVLLDIALDELTLGRAYLGLALAAVGANQTTAATRHDARTACIRLDEAVDGLRAAGTSQHLPSGLLACAAFRRGVGDWDGAARDLDEVFEIAEPGPMKLYLCDLALERARLAFARVGAFVPLNGMLDKENPPKPLEPSTEQIAELTREAEKQLKIAADYIEKCSYHRRDEELTELQAVLRGEKKFADLRPRV